MSELGRCLIRSASIGVCQEVERRMRFMDIAKETAIMELMPIDCLSVWPKHAWPPRMCYQLCG